MTQPMTEPARWEGAEEWMPLAWNLCAEECGADACNELVLEGGPVPEPWGDRWLKYEDTAKRMIQQVRESLAQAGVTLAARPQEQPEPAQPAAQAVEPVAAKLYVEVRECSDCGHVGINDDNGTSACTRCDWSGQSPKEDHCPGCGEDGTMTSACPECGHRTHLLASAHLTAQPQAQPLTDELIAECWKAWPRVSITSSAKAIEFVRAVLAKVNGTEKAQPLTDEKPSRADLIAALKFYASGEHMVLSVQDAWDTVSGEPQNWWCDEAGTATIEDGTIARRTLAGELTAKHIEEIEDGEEFGIGTEGGAR